MLKTTESSKPKKKPSKPTKPAAKKAETSDKKQTTVSTVRMIVDVSKSSSGAKVNKAKVEIDPVGLTKTEATAAKGRLGLKFLKVLRCLDQTMINRTSLVAVDLILCDERRKLIIWKEWPL